MSAPFIILDRKTDTRNRDLKIAGFTTRDIAHTYGVPHGAVQLFVIIQQIHQGKSQPRILLHKRSPHKRIDPEKWDVCGGHLEADPRLLDFSTQDDADQSQLIEQLFWEAGIREANEEVHLTQNDFQFEKQHLHCFDGIGAFETGFDQPLALNREYATAFLAFVPAEVLTLQPGEDLSSFLYMEDSVSVNGQTQEEKIPDLVLYPPDQLVEAYKTHPARFSDGVARVLRRLVREPELLAAFYEGIAAAP